MQAQAELTKMTPKTTVLEAIQSLQGLIIISISVAMFGFVPLIAKDVKPDWTSYCSTLLTIGATAINLGQKKQVAQKGNFESIEGRNVKQINESEATDSSELD